jgi:trimethylguanosine synthase
MSLETEKRESNLPTGVNYSDSPVFDLESMQPYNLSFLYSEFTKMTPHLALFLPRTSDLRQIAEYASDEKKLPCFHYCVRGASKV